MFLILAVVLLVLWLGGFLIFHVSSMLIHLLLLFAVISVIMHFVTGQAGGLTSEPLMLRSKEKAEPNGLGLSRTLRSQR